MNVSGFFITHDLARGLTLGVHSELLSVAMVESSEREDFPFLDAPASKRVEAVLLFLPLAGGNSFLPPPPPLPRCPRRRRSEPWCLQMSRPKYPCNGDRPWSPRPSYLALYRAPEPTSSSEVELLGLQAAEPDSESAPPSLSISEKISREV